MSRFIVAFCAIFAFFTPAIAAQCKYGQLPSSHLDGFIKTFSDDMSAFLGISSTSTMDSHDSMMALAVGVREIEGEIEKLSLVLIIRAEMVNRQDKTMVEDYLSVVLDGVSAALKDEIDATSNSLGKVRGAGLAVQIQTYRSHLLALRDWLGPCFARRR